MEKCLEVADQYFMSQSSANKSCCRGEEYAREGLVARETFPFGGFRCQEKPQGKAENAHKGIGGNRNMEAVPQIQGEKHWVHRINAFVKSEGRGRLPILDPQTQEARSAGAKS